MENDLVPDQSQQALGEILASYIPKLTRLASARISPNLLPRFDGEDVAVSVIRTVLRRYVQGDGSDTSTDSIRRLIIDQSGEFWKLLVTITLNTVRKKTRDQLRNKRSPKNEQALAADGPTIEELAIDYRPTDDEADEYSALLTRLEDALDAPCKVVLCGLIDEKSEAEIAKELNRSIRQIRRYKQQIREVLAALVKDD